MNVAILAPSHVPFMIGGAERLWSDLCVAINATGKHQADIIKLPAPEKSFWSLIDSYRTFSDLNLDHFDMVISGKNPCWMTQHPNHHLYMLHPLRGVYDTYHLFNLPLEVESGNLMVRYIAKACDQGVGTSELFSLLGDLRLSNGEDPSQIGLPSPFLRKILHRFDSNAMKNIRGFSAISKTVASRAEYFHGNDNVKILPPPSGLIPGKSRSEGYFFTYSRLDQAKRIQLLIEAFKGSKVPNEFRIAGSGPELEVLKSAASRDPRIKFLGRLSDDALREELAGCLAVPFIPYQEDYGLVAVEALVSGKPVITTLDSGGPADFVVDGVNGFIAETNAVSLGKAFERASSIRDRERMGAASRESVSMVRWDTVVDGLFSVPSRRGTVGSSRKNILSVSTYPIYPPKGGGQARVFYLCSQLSKAYNVHVICLVDGAAPREKFEPSEFLTIENIPGDQEFSEKDWELYQRSGIPTTDVAIAGYFKLASSFSHRVAEVSRWADVIVGEQPYVAPLIFEIAPNVPFVHNSQNVEYDLKAQMFKDSPLRDEIVTLATDAEGLANKRAHIQIYCSESDRARMGNVYSLPSATKSMVIYNGAATDTISYPTTKNRLDLKRRLFDGRSVALFVASWHQPNIEAVRNIFEIAKQTPDILYLVLGTVGDYFSGSTELAPENITFTGLVSVEEKDLLLQAADCGLNPMSSGSGTNIKMFDYMAAGLPIVSTPVGARGLELPDDIAWIGEICDFPGLLRTAITSGRKIHRRIFVKSKYDWDAVGMKYVEAIATLVHTDSKSDIAN